MLKKFLLWCCRRRKGNKEICRQARAVLIRPLSAALGDGVMTTAALKQLKEALPGVKIGVIVSARNRELFAQCPLVDELVEDGLGSAWHQRGKWDVYLDYPRSFTTATILFAFILNPQFSIAFDKENKKVYTPSSVRVYDAYYPNLSKYHLNAYLKLTPFAFAVQEPIEYVLNVPTMPNPYPTKEKKNILLCPWGSTRRLDAPALAKAVSACARPDICFWLLEKPEAEPYLAALTSIAKHADVRVGKSPTLADFLAFIYYADGVFSVDSAAVHIACAYRKTQAALYNSHADNLHWFGPLSAPGTELVLSGNTSTHKDDFSTFSKDALQAALQQLIARV